MQSERKSLKISKIFMPKTKATEIKNKKPIEEEKIIDIDTEEKDGDLELIPGSTEETDEELEEDAILDDDEVDPFKDKWEE